MSQATLPQELDQADSQPASVDAMDFSYRPVPVIAPVAFILGVSSLLALISEFAVLIAFFGIAFGAVATWKIRKSNGAYGGKIWATVGLFASVIFFFGGIGTHVYAYMTEVPEGYQRVSFVRDISAKEFVYEQGVRKLHPDVAPLDGQKIFIKGWMWGTQKNTGLTDFVLLKDNGQCCFGGNPKPFDMMHVIMEGGKTTDKFDGMVSIAGVLSCDPDGKKKQDAVYILKASYVAPSRTSH